MKVSPLIHFNAGGYKIAGLKYVSFTAISVAIVALPFSISICHASLIVFLCCWFCEGDWRNKMLIIKQNVLLQFIMAFFVAETLGIFYTTNSSAWFEIEKKIFFLLIPVALATTSLKLSKQEQYGLFYLFVMSCFVGTVVCIGNAVYQVNLWSGGSSTVAAVDYLDSSDFRALNPYESYQWLFFSYTALANGIGIHPTFFSLYIAFCIVFLLFQLTRQQGSKKFMYWILILYFSIFIVCLSSRIIIISLFLIFSIAATLAVVNQKTRTTGASLLLLIFMFCVSVYLNPVSRYRNLQEITNTSLTIQSNNVYSNSTQIRASLWWLGLKSYTYVNPLFGTGSGDVMNIMKNTSKEYNITNTLDSFDPHNQFLFTLIGLGIVGLAMLTGLMILSVYIGVVQQDYLFVTFIFLFFSLCITETALELQKGIVFFALFFSLLAFSQHVNVSSLTLKTTVRAQG